MPRLPENRPARREQEHGVAQRCVDRRAAEAPGIAACGRPPREPTRTPRQQQADHVAGIVACIGHERERSGPETAGHLDANKHRIERHAHRHGPVERIGRQSVGMAVRMPVPVMILIVIGVVARHARIIPMTAFSAVILFLGAGLIDFHGKNWITAFERLIGFTCWRPRPCRCCSTTRQR